MNTRNLNKKEIEELEKIYAIWNNRDEANIKLAKHLAKTIGGETFDIINDELAGTYIVFKQRLDSYKTTIEYLPNKEQFHEAHSLLKREYAKLKDLITPFEIWYWEQV